MPWSRPSSLHRSVIGGFYRWFSAVLVAAFTFTLAIAGFAAERIVLEEELEVRGMDCVPQVTEVETRRPIPLICQTDMEVASVDVRYRAEGEGKKWKKLSLKKEDGGWTGTVPCSATSRAGTLKMYVFARNDDRKVVARMGRNTAPMNIKVVESTKLPPPALPNKEPPDRCFSKSECPPEMLGTSACPGTKKGAVAKGGWGAGCSDSSQCQSGLECVGGACESPPKCESTADCPAGGECSDGACHFPTAEELASRLGPPKMHWVGLHLAVDFSLVREATGVCGADTEDSKSYACYRGGNVYTGIPNDANSGAVGSGIHLSTMRALLSYDLVLQRFLFGARAGWAFLGGSPRDFSPIHLELRAQYSLRPGPENNRFRPYLGLAGGYGQVDTASTVNIIDCIGPNDPNLTDDQFAADIEACKAERDPAVLESRIAGGSAVRREFDAYHQGGSIFFGPTFSAWFMFSNESAFVFNLNVMLPNVTFQPSIGYAMGI